MVSYKFRYNKRIKSYLAEIELLKRVFEKMPILPNFEERLRKESLLKSSLYSARIEGNPLTIYQIETSSKMVGKNISKLEVFNLLRAYEYTYLERSPEKLTLNLIFKLHKMVMNNISPNAGKMRKEPWGIFNKADVAVYFAPAHFKLPDLMNEYIKIVGALKHETPVNAAIVQFLFEKIHPFADGNGRVGRLISAYVLKKGGYSYKGLVSFEKFIDDNKEIYYQALEPSKDTSQFVEFFLESLVNQANSFLEELKNKKVELPEDSLLPRRREIFEIIKNHPYCSFNFISRRFAAVNVKTLHYDLLQLQKKNFVQKVGKTRGSVYKAR